MWDLATERALTTFTGHAARVTACAVTSDSNHMISASWDQTLKMWDLATGRTLATLEGHARMTACTVMPDGGRPS
jgi:WD40 repeat protein